MPQTLSGLGSRLREAREARGLTISDVAGATGMSQRALLAMERERFHLLPGGIFRRTYVKAYAEAVGLDGRACVGTYIQQFEAAGSTDEDRRAAADWPRPVLAAALATVLAAILCLAAVIIAGT
jgi:cytoskeletal protein RodZ